MNSRRSFQRRQVSLRALVLLVAFLPTLLFIGHGTGLPGDAGAEDSHQTAGRDTGEHDSHCHTDLSGCANQPVTSGFAQLSLVEALAFAPTLHASALTAGTRHSPPAFVSDVPSPPPRPIA